MIFEIRYKEYNFLDGLQELKLFLPKNYKLLIYQLFNNFNNYFYFIGGFRSEEKERFDFYFADKKFNFYKLLINGKGNITLQESSENEVIEICVDVFKDTSIESWILDRIAYIKKPILIQNF